MSFTTDVSFLRTKNMVKFITESGSQCPLLRTSHFYAILTNVNLDEASRLNVLYYGRLISTIRESTAISLTWLSQCPLLRTSHFYILSVQNTAQTQHVSMSFTTDVSFLLLP